MILTLDKDMRVDPLVETAFNERNPEISPRWTVAGLRVERIRPVRNLRAAIPRREQPSLASSFQRGRYSTTVGQKRARALLRRAVDVELKRLVPIKN